MADPRQGYSAISSLSRVEILHELQQRAHRTISELTAATGLHANTVREHLQRLVEGGFVVQTTERRTTRGRPRVLYSVATGGPDASSPIARRKVAEAAARGDLMRRVMPETGTPSLPEDAVHQLDAIVEHLTESGYDPVVDENELTLDLSPCTHAAAHPEQRDVLCSVHLGLMQGVLSEAGGPLAIGGMRPVCNPTDCVVNLTIMRRQEIA